MAERYNENGEPDEAGKLEKVDGVLTRVVCAAFGCKNKVQKGAILCPACAHIIQVKRASDLWDAECN